MRQLLKPILVVTLAYAASLLLAAYGNSLTFAAFVTGSYVTVLGALVSEHMRKA